MQSWLKIQWYFSDSQISFADREKFIQEFEAVDINSPDQLNSALEVHGDEATHIVSELAIVVG